MRYLSHKILIAPLLLSVISDAGFGLLQIAYSLFCHNGGSTTLSLLYS
jgi:hypothetical protein